MHACMRMNWAYLPTLISPTKNQLESCIYLYLLGEMRVGKTRLTHVYMNAVEKRGKGERARRVGERGREEGRDRGREGGRRGEVKACRRVCVCAPCSGSCGWWG